MPRHPQRSILTVDDAQRSGHTLYAICRNAGCRGVERVDVDRLLHRVDRKSPLLPQPRHVPHFTDGMRCKACGWRGVNLWLEPKVEAPRPQQAPAAKLPNYEIRDWGKEYPHSDSITISTAENLFIARGAYIAAAGFYFDRRITLQQGAFVIKDSKRDGLPAVMTHEEYRQLRALESGELSADEAKALAATAAAKAG